MLKSHGSDRNYGPLLKLHGSDRNYGPLGTVYHIVKGKTVIASVRFFDIPQLLQELHRKDVPTYAMGARLASFPQPSVPFENRPLLARVVPRLPRYSDFARKVEAKINDGLKGNNGMVDDAFERAFIPMSSDYSYTIPPRAAASPKERTAAAFPLSGNPPAQDKVGPCPRCSSTSTRRSLLHTNRAAQVCSDCRTVLPLEDMDTEVL